ncbi:MAG: hypothetical protein ABI690_04570 [Chloroflexota bacterium]
MATQDILLSTSYIEEQLENAKRHIKAKNYAKAKMILNDLDHPTALRWREKLEEMEMFAENTESARPKIKPASQTPLLAEVTSIFLSSDWTVTTQLGNTIIVEKKKTPSSLASAALLAFFGLIGMFIVLIAIANAKVERITLTDLEDGTIRLTGAKSAAMVVRDPQDALKMAQSVKKGASYAATLALGIGATVVWAFLLH